jgi:Bax protein
MNKNKVVIAALMSALMVGCGDTPNSDESVNVASLSKPNFSAMTDVNEKKSAFFAYLMPSVEQENKRVTKERDFLLKIKAELDAGKSLDSEEIDHARRLSKMYSVSFTGDGVTDTWLSHMLRRVDVLPKELVLSQAANESAWGTSRFATEGNNYFGQWCYRKGCGLVPLARNEGSTHEVAVFESAYRSVNAYFMNVNRNSAYAELRELRAAQRRAGKPIEGTKLAEGLIRYSERGNAYVTEIQAMIKHNNKYWSQG